MIVQMALPIAPILLLPFIALFFVVVFPLWVVALVVLGILLVLARVIESMSRIVRPTLGQPLSRSISNAFHWTLSWGGLAERRDRPKQESE